MIRNPLLQFMLCVVVCLASVLPTSAQALVDNPLVRYNLAWTGQVRWKNVVDITSVAGDGWSAKLAKAQAHLTGQGGGVVFFPAGTYGFTDHVRLLPGVVLRGAEPAGAKNARDEKFTLPTRFEFPAYKPAFEGAGAATDSAFKGIVLAEPGKASRNGVVHIALERGHIHFADAADKSAGRDCFVVGCILRNAAVAAKDVPDVKAGQHAWQRWTARHRAAIDLRVEENALVANNRLPFSGEQNFLQKGYLLRDPKTKKMIPIEVGVLFDYDNRPGIYLNDYGIGAGGGNGPAGTPKTHPWGFRKGLVIRDNLIESTGRCAIAFAGDGVFCGHNEIRFKENVDRWTVTGLVGVTGSGTNDNRAIQMRGYRWAVEKNRYTVHRNRAMFGKYLINDGEGLMHEAHVNSAIVQSKVIGNVGNAYISIYKAHGIGGLIIRDNEIRTVGGIDAIYVSSNYNGKHFPCKNVLVENNVTAGTGIRIDGKPGEHNVIRNNRHEGKEAALRNLNGARLENNRGYFESTK